jgi:GT2 family glycosyltransferase
MKVDVIILTDSSDEFMTQRTINSLIRSDDHEFFIILIDSGEYNPIKYTFHGDYLAINDSFNYNKFLNVAFKRCTSDWIVISNDDVEYSRGWFTEILKVSELRSDIESFSPRDPLFMMKYYPRDFQSGELYYEGYQVSKYVQGWSLVIKKDALDMIRPFDEQFDMYYQDNDYAEKLKQFDIKHALVYNSLAHHLNSMNVGTINKKFLEDEIKFRTKWQIWT